MPTVEEGELFSIIVCAAEKVGAPKDEAGMFADNLVTANLRGIDSHGVANLPKYVRRVKKGIIVPGARTKLVRDSNTTVVVDGGFNFGQVVGRRAMEIAVDRAQKYGVGVVSVKNCDTLGMLAYYSMIALKQDMIGIAMCNTHAAMAPCGGFEAVLGNNPVSIAIPTGKERPIVLDMATSVVAKSKIVLALREKRKIPVGWALDDKGQQTRDPEAALEGALLPFGAHKGYGLSVIIATLAGGLSGSRCDRGSISFGLTDASRPNVGQLLMALNVENFVSLEDYQSRIHKMMKDIKYSRRLLGTTEIMLPGEPEFLTAEKRKREGIPIGEEIWSSILDCLKELGIDMQDS